MYIMFKNVKNIKNYAVMLRLVSDVYVDVIFLSFETLYAHFVINNNIYV